jgi:hypothetical protein
MMGFLANIEDKTLWWSFDYLEVAPKSGPFTT